ncbi:uncharacterized protein HMPREF1541_00205 [Cyphellophora europaea CBS 101466]|uniref:Uncharacterized protein n=1 Tax=Cyphellophora europaea (strain CBS 101466) TaxID=1220924 RepID=W2SBE3_CYPE1|nr:uncharacterized protein HMPREF1541_00205 [Cyphellophora europaea CBS 101466]ETN46022.1 hypothetical protein HMPREF1541_00205 [Cyphellophora europaea CBS 101466]
MVRGRPSRANAQQQSGPGQPGFLPTQRQRLAYERVLRRLLQPHVVHRHLMFRHLILNNWDVDAAHTSLLAEINQRRGLPGSVAPALPQATANNPVTPTDTNEAHRIIDDLPSETYHEDERRAAAVKFRDLILSLPGAMRATLSISEAVLLLHLAGWDMHVAREEWRGHDDALNRLHVNFDRMRSPEGTKVIRKASGEQERQDERLALLIALTGRADWRSLQLFLQSEDVQFNVVHAIVIWFRTGIGAARAKRDQKTRRDSLQQELPMPSAKSTFAPVPDNSWRQEAEFFRRVNDFDPANDNLVPLPPLREDNRGKRPFGFLIEPDRTPLQAGRYFAEEYFTVDYITGGKYKAVSFSRKEYKWPRLDDSSTDSEDKDKPRYDFSKEDDIKKINAFRRQPFSRATGVLIRKGSQVWFPIENALLHQSLKNAFEKHQQAHGNSANAPKFGVSDQLIQQLADGLNDAFVGTRPGATAAIRGERTAEAVATQSRRFFPNVEEFGIPMDSNWFNKKRKVSAEKYKANQREELKQGLATLVSWIVSKERTAQGHVDESAADGENYDAGIESDDDEATKERKRHDNRSLMKLIRENQEKVEAAKKRRAAQGNPNGGEDPPPGEDSPPGEDPPARPRPRSPRISSPDSSSSSSAYDSEDDTELGPGAGSKHPLSEDDE